MISVPCVGFVFVRSRAALLGVIKSLQFLAGGRHLLFVSGLVAFNTSIQYILNLQRACSDMLS